MNIINQNFIFPVEIAKKFDLKYLRTYLKKNFHDAGTEFLKCYATENKLSEKLLKLFSDNDIILYSLIDHILYVDPETNEECKLFTKKDFKASKFDEMQALYIHTDFTDSNYVDLVYALCPNIDNKFTMDLDTFIRDSVIDFIVKKVDKLD